MTDSSVSRFLSGIALTGLGKITVVVFGLAGLMVITRAMPTTEVGAYLILQAVVILLKELCSFGINLILPKLLVDADENERRRITSTAIWFRLMCVVVAGIIAVAFARPLFGLFGIVLEERIILFVPLLMAVETFVDLNAAVYQGRYRFGVIGAMNGISSLLNFVGILGLVLLGEQGILGLIWAKVVSRGLALLIAWYFVPVRPTLEFDVSYLQRLVRLGTPLGVNYLMSFLFQRMDTFIVGILLGSANVALYEVAKRIPSALIDFYEAFGQVYFPFMASLSAENKRRASNLLNRTSSWLVFAGLLGATVAILFGTQFVTLLFSSTYAASGPAFGLLMVSATVVMLDSNLGYALIANGEGKRIPLINSLRTVIGFIGYFVFIPPWGIVGAALAGIVSILSVNPINVHYLRRVGINVNVANFLKAAIAFATPIILFVVLQRNDVAIKVGLALLFPAFAFAVKLITVGDIALLLKEGRSMLSRYGGRKRADTLQATVTDDKRLTLDIH